MPIPRRAPMRNFLLPNPCKIRRPSLGSIAKIIPMTGNFFPRISSYKPQCSQYGNSKKKTQCSGKALKVLSPDTSPTHFLSDLSSLPCEEALQSEILSKCNYLFHRNERYEEEISMAYVGVKGSNGAKTCSPTFEIRVQSLGGDFRPDFANTRCLLAPSTDI
ncbi:unnamed protein product [Lepeophtheirus salmonis]|uniref:(salmon louse) hypothetical protein n=1 Tax=Lepeophtheirus salmonis TaxID=72036 RepID=A0A7R8CV93_LEPSM|nr:unnamed protein product [Lepeophtheirus salmonis]CAF2941885.1 unnamed protein product [Lepeophtheirus salmonis]